MANKPLKGINFPGLEGTYTTTGEITPEGGEIFNNYTDNIADELGHAEGFKTNAGHTGHAEGDHTEASWRSHAEGYHTHAENTAHAGGRLSIATGKGSFAQGLGRPIDVKVNNILVKSTENILLTSNIIPLDTDIRSVLQIGDFVYLFLLDSGGNKIIEPTDSKRIEQISEDGKTLTLSDCFLAFNYDETSVPTPEDGGEPVIPMGAGLRKDVPCQALGEGSIAVGKGVIASGAGSSASGMDTISSGLYSHAEGNGSTAIGQTSHAEGRSTTASGVYSHSEGNKTFATAEGAHSEGTNTQANGSYSHSEGHYTKANGQYSHAEGGSAIAEGQFSHAEGYHTHAKGEYQHVQGKYNILDNHNEYAHIVGNGDASTPSNAYTLDWNGQGWFKQGLKIGGNSYFDENAKKIITEDDISNLAKNTDLVGRKTQNSGEIFNDYSGNTAIEEYAHAEGRGTDALGKFSHAEGKETTASGEDSHAEGYNTHAHGIHSHAEGWSTYTEKYAHAEGVSTKALGDASHAEGYKTEAIGPYSHAEGQGTIAQGTAQHVQGRWNDPLDGNYLHIVGNGTGENVLNEDGSINTKNRSNCHTLSKTGNAWFAGDVYVGGTSMANATKLSNSSIDFVQLVSNGSLEGTASIVINNVASYKAFMIYGQTNATNTNGATNPYMHAFIVKAFINGSAKSFTLGGSASDSKFFSAVVNNNTLTLTGESYEGDGAVKNTIQVYGIK